MHKRSRLGIAPRSLCVSMLTAILTILTLPAFTQQLAFPGAEGFGAYASGGRGGTVVHVTNLNPSGEGSLAEAVSRSNRIVVFDVGGVINLSGHDPIKVSDSITIAGQTAPGEGITIYGNRLLIKSENVIMRYIRIRGSIKMSRGSCPLVCDSARNLIIDHCSISWGRWDCCHIKNASDVTWQNCIIAEGIDPQRFGAFTDGTRNWTITHCLWASQKSRNPKLKCYVQQINNVVFNYGSGSIGGHSAGKHYQDVIGNYYISSHVTGKDNHWKMWTETDHLYMRGNYTDTNCDGRLNGILITEYPQTATPMSEPSMHPKCPVTIESAEAAYYTIIAHCGASLHRDVHDNRVIRQLKALGREGGFIDNENDIGGIGSLKGGKHPKDNDKDGIPDVWERKHGLNPYNPSDAMTDADGDGYANIENYINSLVP